MRGELSRLAKEKERLFAELGRSVMSWEQNLPRNFPFADNIAAIKSIEAQEAERQQELARIQQASYSAQQLSTPVQASSTPMVSCPSCQAQVPITAAHCPSCGCDLSAARQQYKRCAKCGTYYPADNRFCINDGCELEDIPNPKPAPDLPAGSSGSVDSFGSSDVAVSAEEQPVVEEVQVEVVQVEEQQPAQAQAVESQHVEVKPEVAPVVKEVQPEEQPVQPEEPVVEVEQVQKPQVENRFCPVCGEAIGAGDIFCGSCGNRLG